MSMQWRGKGGDEGRECDGKTILSEIWKEWEKTGELKQKIEIWLEVGDC